MKYRSEIDGLRALAILPVVFYHSGIGVFSGGYVGVDIFFVISGYLITSILYNELSTDSYSLLTFYERRTRRILPALFVVTLCCLPFAWFLLGPGALKEFSQSLVSVFSFTSNFYFYLKTGYFDIASESKPFLHTWSLAVEEQFYVIYPIAIFLVWKYMRTYMVPLLVSTLILSIIVSQYHLNTNYSASFYLLHSRAWELLSGALAFLYLLNKGNDTLSRFTNLLSLLGMCLILGSIFLFDKNTPFPGLFALVPVFGTVLVILFTKPEGIVYKVLSYPLFIGIGLVSYSAYLWHQPALAFYRSYTSEEPNKVASVVLIFVIFLLSFLTYRYVETPFRKRRVGAFSRNAVFTYSIIGMLLFVGIGGVGHALNGVPSRNAGFLRLQQNYGLSSECSGASIDSDSCKTLEDPKAILWGDSIAMHLGLALSNVYSDVGLHQTTLSGCPPVPNYKEANRKAAISCFDYNEGVLSYLLDKKDPSEYVVLLSTARDLSEEAYRSDFIANVNRLKKLRFNIVLISATPQFIDVDKCIIDSTRKGKSFDDCVYGDDDIRNFESFELISNLTQELGIDYISLKPFFCDNGNCVIEKDGILLLRDAIHISVEAMPMLESYLSDRLPKSVKIAK